MPSSTAEGGAPELPRERVVSVILSLGHPEHAVLGNAESGSDGTLAQLDVVLLGAREVLERGAPALGRYDAEIHLEV